jgi:hypothetical protein
MKKLRAYKGIKYLPTIGSFQYGGQSYKSAAYLVTHLPFLTDDDHAPLMDLKKTPYEPTPKLEDVLESAYTEWNACRNTGITMFSNLFQFTARRLRNAFPHIDGEDA